MTAAESKRHKRLTNAYLKSLVTVPKPNPLIFTPRQRVSPAKHTLPKLSSAMVAAAFLTPSPQKIGRRQTTRQTRSEPASRTVSPMPSIRSPSRSSSSHTLQKKMRPRSASFHSALTPSPPKIGRRQTTKPLRQTRSEPASPIPEMNPRESRIAMRTAILDQAHTAVEPTSPMPRPVPSGDALFDIRAAWKFIADHGDQEAESTASPQKAKSPVAVRNQRRKLDSSVPTQAQQHWKKVSIVARVTKAFASPTTRNVSLGQMRTALLELGLSSDAIGALMESARKRLESSVMRCAHVGGQVLCFSDFRSMIEESVEGRKVARRRTQSRSKRPFTAKRSWFADIETRQVRKVRFSLPAESA